MSMDAKCDHARFCRVDRTYQSEQARITLSVDRSGVRDSVVSALQQLGAARKYGRAPPTLLARELQQWLDTLLDKNHSSQSEMDDDGEKRGSTEDGAGSKREGVISLSTCGTCLFVEGELVERRDARLGCLADLFNG